jgi:hypothetical protein
MLVLDSHWIPLATPDTADTTKAAVRTAMMPIRTALPVGPMPATISRPVRICRAPRPSDVADPNRVAKMAKMSMTLPRPPLARSPRMGSNAAEISCSRPLRYTP